MRVDQLTKDVEGKRIRVIRVAPTEAEALGYVDDTARLLGQVGTAQRLTGGPISQLWVKWDGPRPGSLSLASQDEVEILPD